MFKQLLLLILTIVLFAGISFASPYYVGDNGTTCIGCHNETVSLWQGTAHSSAHDNLAETLGYSCLSCHNTGWDTEIVNFGADEYVTAGDANAYTFSDEASFNKVKNVQCETCHGPLGNEDHTFLGYSEHREAAVVTFAADNCGSCHEGSHHPTYSDWQSSKHAVSKETSIPGGSMAFIKSDPTCSACHTAEGFIQFVDSEEWEPHVEAPGEAGHDLTCAACHDPHSHQIDGQLRLPKDEICGKCHNPEYNPDQAVEPHGEAVHHSTAFMFEGKGGYEYEGWEYPNSAHTNVVSDKCVTCHVFKTDYQSGPPEVSAFTGHSFEPHLQSCSTCHGSFVPADSSFDYRGTQTDIQTLTDQLGTILASASSKDSVSVDFYRAKFNYDFVTADGSMGIHNTKYAKALLESAIANFNPSGVESSLIAPLSFALNQNYPNPFNPTTTISFVLKNSGNVTVKLYNAMGQEIKTVLNEYRGSGSHEIVLDMNEMPSGVYVYTISTNDYNDSKKMVLMK